MLQKPLIIGTSESRVDRLLCLLLALRPASRGGISDAPSMPCVCGQWSHGAHVCAEALGACRVSWSAAWRALVARSSCCPGGPMWWAMTGGSPLCLRLASRELRVLCNAVPPDAYLLGTRPAANPRVSHSPCLRYLIVRGGSVRVWVPSMPAVQRDDSSGRRFNVAGVFRRTRRVVSARRNGVLKSVGKVHMKGRTHGCSKSPGNELRRRCACDWRVSCGIHPRSVMSTDRFASERSAPPNPASHPLYARGASRCIPNLSS